MKTKYLRPFLLLMIAVSFFSRVYSQQHSSDYREIVLSIPELESDKLYQSIEQLFKDVPGVEITLRCKRSELLVLKIDTRVQPDANVLLRRISESNLKAVVMEGYDYNKAVAVCSDYKPD
jgi:hypothetical protein